MNLWVTAVLLMGAVSTTAQEIIVSRETEQYQQDSVFALQVVEVIVKRGLDIRMGEWRLFVRFESIGTPEQNYSGKTTVLEAYNVAYILLDLDDFRNMSVRMIDETIVHELFHVKLNKVAEAAMFNVTGRLRELARVELESFITGVSRMFVWGNYPSVRP